MDTLATMRGQILRYIKDDEDPQLIADSINDSIESLWLSCILVHLGQFLGGPISNLNIAPGSERVTIVSVPDPPALIMGNWSQQAQDPILPQLPARAELFTITYVTESGSETNYSTPLQVNPGLGQLSIITPPTAPNLPSGFPIGYNVYASGLNAAGVPDPNALYKQNPLPIRFDQTWVELDEGLLQDGDLPPVSNTTADNIFFLRILEVQNQDQTWTRWTAGSLDGLLMDRAVKAIAPSNSSYTNYAFDFVNGNTVEIRPAAGSQLSPRYFFVVKPRRLRFDESVIPFTNLAYTEFIKTYASAQIKRSNHEYTAASQEANAAESARTRILEGLNTQATTKQKNITPFMRW